MNEKLNLYYLVDVISKQTQLDPKVVKIFITQLFREIEKGVAVSSVVKIDNFGLFRIIKSLSADKLLFLGKFGNEGAHSEPQEETAEASPEIDTPFHELPDAFYENRTNPVSVGDYSEGINDHVEMHEDATTEYTGILLDEDKEFIDRIEESYSDYEEKSWYKKIPGNTKNIVLFLITIIIVVGVLYGLYSYSERDTNEFRYVPSYAPSYTELENEDTLNFSHVIITESDIDFAHLSRIYYGYEIFWSYIYKANEDNISSALEIPPGSVIRIPKLDETLIDIHNEESVESAKLLNAEILKLRIENQTVSTDTVSTINGDIE
ncbi:hypothetical protein [Viscerimonas tarda]